jgi:hypothetical protein
MYSLLRPHYIVLRHRDNCPFLLLLENCSFSETEKILCHYDFVTRQSLTEGIIRDVNMRTEQLNHPDV